MRAIRWILAVLLAVTAVLYISNGILERISHREEGPVIHCQEELLEISVHDDVSALLTGITAEDPQDGEIEVIVGTVSQLIGGDRAKVTYLAFDRDDNMATYERQVRYTDYHRPVIRLTEPLEYASREEARLLSRVTVTDAVDGDLSDRARVSTLWATDDPRVYSATVMVANSMGDIASVDVPVIIRSDASGIRLREQIVYLEQGSGFDPMDYVASGGSGLEVSNEVDVQRPGCYWVWYRSGSGGDLAILTVVVE